MRARRRNLALLLAMTFGALLPGACDSRKPAPAPAPTSAPGAEPARPEPTAEPTHPAPGAERSFVELAKRLSPAVVSIKTSRLRRGDPYARLFGERDDDGAPSLGSGVIIDTDGTIVTNDHVIAGGDDIRVALVDGTELPARIIGRDDDLDVALLKVDPGASPLVAAPLGDSDRLEVGSWVLVIGNPFGLEHTVTAGIVSAVGRTTRDVPVGKRSVYQTFIQTDASINPGNSGGPLIDTTGLVVGIATAIDARGGGIGFAVPISMVKEVLPHLQRDGRLVRSWLGVYLQPVSADLALRLGLPTPRGVFVTGTVERSPAARAGLARGDVILAFDGHPVDERSLPWRASLAGPGKDAELTVWRNAAQQKVTVKLERLPE